jgi:cysteine desulfurase/selenocysteine lyase
VLNIEQIREDFPLLKQIVHNYPLAYMDNGATTQKPQVVIDTIRQLYSQHNSSIHRGVHYLSEKITDAYENTRNIIKDFIHAANSHEVIFTSGTTGSINTVAFSFGEKYINPGDEIIVSEMEHHANIVPWQMLCERKGAILKIMPIKNNGELLIGNLENLISGKTKILALTHVSNTLGTINPVRKIIKIAHSFDIPVLIDGAQAIQHGTVDVRDLDCDFYVFSGHKVYGPNGIGILYGKEKWLDQLPPFQGGGDMIKAVTFKKTTYNDLPFKFEAGTTNYIGAIGLGKALEYLTRVGRQNISDYENELLQYGTEQLNKIEGLKIYGNAKNKISVFSFLIEGIHQYDAGMILDKFGIAVRTGTHCAQPVMDKFGIDGTIRASLVFYNTKSEIDRLVEALLKVKRMFSIN